MAGRILPPVLLGHAEALRQVGEGSAVHLHTEGHRSGPTSHGGFGPPPNMNRIGMNPWNIIKWGGLDSDSREDTIHILYTYIEPR